MTFSQYVTILGRSSLPDQRLKTSIARALLLLAIRAYQRYLSPRKGFRCAYRVHTGCASCSQFGYRAIQRYGVPGLMVLRRRLALCAEVYQRLHRARPGGPMSYQAGDCDPGCDFGACGPGDRGSSLGDCACQAADCFSWGSSDKRRRDQDS